MCLEGTVHPVFQNWTTADAEFYEELRQPLLLASKILDTDVALEWISDFIIDDIFSRDYPGAQHPHAYNCIGIQQNLTPYSIARHHKASWASPEKRKFWLDRASRKMSHGIAKSVTWQLDADMFLRKGWSGYTCRHRRNSSSIPIPLDELDSYATIEAEDRACREQGLSQRHLTILLMAEYPARLRELREKGDGSSEEYMFTAFMAAVTILHELAHAIYWRDFRSLSKGMREPYYGNDLEMELGESFIAHLFGGYVPVPLKGIKDLKEGLTWKEFLSWDCHRVAAISSSLFQFESCSIDFGSNSISKLFQQSTWKPGPISGESTNMTLLRDQTLPCCHVRAIRKRSPNRHGSSPGREPCYLLPDFHLSGEGWKWNRRPGAPFRIPQYDDYMCPDLSLPIAPDNTIMEPQPRRQYQSTTEPRTLSVSLNESRLHRNDESTTIQVATDCRDTMPGDDPVHEITVVGSAKPTGRRSYLEVPHISRFSGLDMVKKPSDISSIKRGELTVDELKKRLSHLIGVSLCELETLFD
ncbi:hypothetical protein PG996_009638, partial [Apiospora saccharicola]